MQYQMGWRKLASFQQHEQEKRDFSSYGTSLILQKHEQEKRNFSSYGTSLILQEENKERKKYLGELNEIKQEVETITQDKLRLKETVAKQNQKIKELESQIAVYNDAYLAQKAVTNFSGICKNI